MKRYTLIAAALVLLVLAWSVQAQTIFTENFNGYSGTTNNTQYQTGLPVATGGNVPGWSKSGAGAVHAVNLGLGNMAIMFYQDNVITLTTGIAANANGGTYKVEFDYGTADYAGGQATRAGDGLLVEVLRADNSVLASGTYTNSAWSNPANVNLSAGLHGILQYVGDGSGVVRLRIGPTPPLNSGFFEGEIDNLSVSLAYTPPSVTLTAPANGWQFFSGSSISSTATVANGTSPYTVNFYTNYNSGAYGLAGTTNASPYAINLGTLADGTYTIYATVTDNVSSNATSATNTFTVVGADTTPPTPNPMTFAVIPAALSSTSIVMTASTATDALSPPVEYFFTNTVNGSTSGWILSTVWTNTGLIGGTTYGFQVKARDAALNETTNSAVVYAVPAPRTLYWDGGTADIDTDGDGASAGGNGTWNTTTRNWDVGSAPHVAWISTNDTAVFGGTAGTVTLGENVTVGGLQFSASGYTIGGAKTLAFGAASSITNNTGNVTFTDGACVTNFAGTVYIGYNNGNSGRSVTIENGGKWFGGNVYVGYAAGASANNNRYNVGGPGAASVVSNSAIFVGGPQSRDASASQGYNTMVVSNATLQMGGQLSIGFGGNTMNNNQVIVDNQGTVQMGNNSIVICASSYGYPHWNNNGLVITNGGYLSAGALTVNKGDANNYALVANGGTLVSVAAPAIKGLMTIVGGGSTGPTSTWNLTSNNLVTANGTLTVDGNGLAGGAVVTNAGVLIVGPDNSSNGTMLMTNGAQVFATSVVVGQSTGGADDNNLLTIVGGAGVTSVLKAGGGSVTVGYMGGNGGINNNRLLIGAGGVLTNAGSMWVGYRPGGGQYNGFGGQQLVVTNGGQLFTTGNSGISYDNSGGSLSGDGPSTATIGGTNSIDGVRSLWDLGGGNLTVGFYNGGQNNINNGLMVTAGGILANAGLITIGAGNAKSFRNYMTVSNASLSSIGLMIGASGAFSNTVTVSGNSFWNLGAGPLTVGSGSVSNVLAVTGGTLTNAGIVNIRANNTLSLAAGCQVFANSATNAGTMAVGIDTTMTPACGCLNVTSNLNVNTASLNISATGKPIGVFVVASYGALTGTGVFAATNGLPENCKLYMDYKGLKQIAIVGNAAGTIISLF